MKTNKKSFEKKQTNQSIISPAKKPTKITNVKFIKTKITKRNNNTREQKETQSIMHIVISLKKLKQTTTNKSQNGKNNAGTTQPK